MDRVRLTRRDALKALSVGGGSLIVSEAITQIDLSNSNNPIKENEFETILAVAETIYPSRIEVTDRFIQSYVAPLPKDRKASMSQIVKELNRITKTQFGEPFYKMTRAQRDTVLRSIGVDKAPSRPNGNLPQRVKYYLINSLLYALFTTPKGSKLAGIENPVGHPGGFATYVEE